MSEVVFAAHDVHFAYGAAPVLRGIDIEVTEGEIVGLVGAFCIFRVRNSGNEMAG